jgi:hypothetical protein
MIDLTKLKTAQQKAAEASQKARNNRIAELKKLLEESDYKAMPDYDKPDPVIVTQRQEWRVEIRALENNGSD